MLVPSKLSGVTQATPEFASVVKISILICPCTPSERSKYLFVVPSTERCETTVVKGIAQVPVPSSVPTTVVPAAWENFTRPVTVAAPVRVVSPVTPRDPVIVLFPPISAPPAHCIDLPVAPDPTSPTSYIYVVAGAAIPIPTASADAST